jgi:hypothetical protein
VSKIVSNRFFVYFFMAILSLFLLFHITVWEIFTKKLLAPEAPTHVGDLARMSYQFDSLQMRKTGVSLPKQHITSSSWRGEKVDVITFGDSFSIGAAGGENPYYQDFIVNETGLRVLNIERDPYDKDEDFLKILIGIINGGFLDQVKPKIIILETVERLALLRLSQDIDWQFSISPEDVAHAMKKNINNEMMDVSLVNSANYKFFLYNFYYRFSENALNHSQVYRVPLNRNVFNSKASNILLYYFQDVTSMELVNEVNILKMNQNLNRLAKRLEEKNIKLVFMPAVDKYDLYRPYMINPIHEKPLFFDLLRPLEKEYYFVDTKKVLSALVENNVTDVFYGDDTHWSPKASAAVVHSIPFYDLAHKKQSIYEVR